MSKTSAWAQQENPDVEAEVPDFLRGGGEMGALMRAHDWSGTALGALHSWPQSLRTVVRLMLNTGHPMYIWWGPERACLYNDAYRHSIGPERHPGSLGRPAREVWAEIWDIINPQIEQVMSGGGATWHIDQLVPITRYGHVEDVYWTYSYSPIDDESAPGGIGGVLVVCTETTQQVLTARQLADERNQLAQLFDQSPTFMALLRGAEHRFELANPAYLALVGGRPVLGRTVAEALPEAVEQGYVELLDQVFATGEAFVANGARFETRQTSDHPAVDRFVDFVYQPLKDAEGQVTSIFVNGVDVTERALAEQAMSESEARFRSALQAGRMGSWETDYQSMTRHWTAEGMALFGLALPEGRGQVGGAQDEYVATMHPEDRHLAGHFRKLADRQDSFGADYRIVRSDGTLLWLSGRGLVVARGPDGRAQRLISIMADATERKQAEAQLRIEHERLELALNVGRMGAYDMNLRNGELWWSAQTYQIFGVSPDSFVPTPQSVLDLLHPDEREAFLRLRDEAIAEGRPFVHEFRIVRPDGTEAWVAHRGQAEYDAEGRVLRNFGITMDISERKQSEVLLREADRKKDRFIAVLAHELRNPLAAIANALEVLRRSGPAAPKAAWCQDIIARQVKQMTHLLDDLLDASRLSRGQLRLRPKVLDLATAIEHAMEIAAPHVEAAHHTLNVSMPGQALELEGDLTRLAQIFSNILINAAKYTPPHGTLSLACVREGAQAVVTITDNGIGIETQHMPQIFEMFGQVESASNRSQGGQGIGLALAKGLVEMHGGSILVRSEGLGRGSSFEVRLPLLAARRAPPPSSPSETVPVVRQDARRVLIVDDLQDAADSLAEALRAEGHAVDVAYDGEQALRLAESVRPEVVLLDLGMPKMDGFEVCRRLRATDWGFRPLVVAQTGWGQKHDRERTRDAGFDHHVVKPVALDDVLALLRRVER
ncbi:hybrid sensor histidine kinase/response regulator [Variovorax sp. GT1P44]|uniref:hybrid sensor histidine kinase/response regulator n=1 Tax=Variovorax sp. GT1P44 TaxID=3443742 RepID=UPI003F46FB16